MAPYVCEEKWQDEVGSERRPTPLPPPTPVQLCAPHIPSSQLMHQTSLPPVLALCHLNTLGWLCKSLCTLMDITHPAAVFISLSGKRADGRATVMNRGGFWKLAPPCVITVISEIRTFICPCYCDCTLVLTSLNTSAFTVLPKVAFRNNVLNNGQTSL